MASAHEVAALGVIVEHSSDHINRVTARTGVNPRTRWKRENHPSLTVA